jgi:hypothetical protein
MEERQEKSEEGENNTRLNLVSAGASNRVARYIFRRVAEEASPYEQTIRIEKPFYVNEQFLQAIGQHASQQISSDDEVPSTDKFTSRATFDDMSSISHSSFEACLREAGSRREPLAISLEWERFFISEIGDFYYRKIWITIHTERKFQGVDDPTEVGRAFIALTVSGSGESWTEATFHKLRETLTLALFDKRLRWLEVFRRPMTILIFTQIFAWIGFYTFLQVTKVWELTKLEDRIDRTYDRIISYNDIGAKINELAYSIWYANSQPWWYTMTWIISGCIGYAVFLTIGMPIVSSIAPISVISVGAAGRQAEDRLTWYRWRVVTFGLGVVVIPVLTSHIPQLVSYFLHRG